MPPPPEQSPVEVSGRDSNLDERLRALLAQAPEAIVLSDEHGRIIAVNPAAERMYGHSAADVVGRDVLAVAAELGAREAQVEALRGALGGIPGRYETDRFGGDVEVEMAPLRRDGDGGVCGLVVTARDITARRRAERRAAFLAEASHVLSGSLDLQGTLERINALLVPAWADASAIALRDAEGRLAPAALQHADPRRLELAHEVFAATAREPIPGLMLDQVLSGAAAMHSADLSAAPAVLREAGVRELVVAPLRVRGAVLGVLVAALTGDSGRSFDSADVDLVQSVADRAAQAIDNARLMLAERVARSAAERAALETQAADARFRAAFEHAPAGIALLRAEDGDLRYVEVNPALCEISGYPREELIGRSVHDFLHPEDAGEENLRVLRAIASGERDEDDRELRHIRPDGELRWVKTHLAPLHDEDGRTFVAQVQDVTDRRRFERELERLAAHDPLTGLLNRRRFEEELEKVFAHVRRHGDEAAVIVLGLDDFKHVNETYGHATGDHLLRLAAQELRDRVRSTDAVARLGGDEFGIVLTRTSLEEATAVAEGLLERFRTAVAAQAGERTVRATASAGVRLLAAGGDATAADLLGEADLAMYDAKDRGRDRVSVVGAADLRPERIRGRLRWAERIRDALEHDRFVLYEQPIVSLRTGEVERAELLIRMLDESGGGDPIPPGAFLPTAERYGHIRAIDRWVVRTAIALLAERQRAGSAVGAEVNLSGDSLTDASVIDFIVAEIRNAGIDASALTFEVTETAAIGNFERARRLAAQLSALGCAFALDDFGAGFGSFSYLKHLPFASIKIDGEFIRSLPRSPSDQVTVRGVVDIARALGKQTVGEFVEDAETLVLLRRLGVDRAQGFFVGEPRPACALPDFEAPARGLSRPS